MWKFKPVLAIVILIVLTACEKDKVTDGPLVIDPIALFQNNNTCDKEFLPLNIDSLISLGQGSIFPSLVNKAMCKCDTLDVIISNIPANHIVFWSHALFGQDTLIPPTGIVSNNNSFLHIWDTLNVSTQYLGQLNVYFDTCQ